MSNCVVPAGRAGKRPAQHDQIEFAAVLGFFERGELRRPALRAGKRLLRRSYDQIEFAAALGFFERGEFR